ncbi:MAG: hypothetical protein QHH05_09570 [Syntrophomonadaceae bacterium]|jgi:O6-methylguanine-DNA--protein-cysteine methyltransferase|nr:hypothetical protein [Syntrophomonadaceae bacterium]MDH7498674.1 hypothetical protein [Syntrophomonadaceae bacterium]
MDEQAVILQRLQETASGQRISCTEARRIAEELGVSPRAVGAACDELGIKIFACELGCF